MQRSVESYPNQGSQLTILYRGQKIKFREVAARPERPIPPRRTF